MNMTGFLYAGENVLSNRTQRRFGFFKSSSAATHVLMQYSAKSSYSATHVLMRYNAKPSSAATHVLMRYNAKVTQSKVAQQKEMEQGLSTGLCSFTSELENTIAKKKYCIQVPEQLIKGAHWFPAPQSMMIKSELVSNALKMEQKRGILMVVKFLRSNEPFSSN